MVSKTIFLILIISILFISGCIGNDGDITELVKQSQQGKEFLSAYPNADITAVRLSNDTISSMIDEIRKECDSSVPIESYWKVKFSDPDTNTELIIWSNTKTLEPFCFIKKVSSEINEIAQEHRKNCRELDGYLCSSEGRCALPWIDSSDSYCCPIECNVCTKKITDNCKTNELCVEAICSPETDFNCEFRDITPCANNGICEEGEYDGEVTSCEGSSASSVSGKAFENSDCPKTCDDGNENTADYFNFTTQKCEHSVCGGVTITGNTYDFNNVFVTIKMYNVKDKGIGEHISIKNNRDDVVIIGTGCNYPISPYANGCRGWSLRPYEDYPTFNHKYVEPNTEVDGWVWGINVDFLEPYNTSLIKLTIYIDGEEISFVKNMEYIDDFEETTNFESVYEKIIPGCGNNDCEEDENFSNCPEDCENPCPSSCEDNNPFTKGFCDETTNYECIFEEAMCGEEDNICPPNGEFTDKDGGCYNSDDEDCSLMFSYNIDQNYACGNSYNFRQFAFIDNRIFWLNNEYLISDQDPTTKEYDFDGEIINTVAVDTSNIYYGTNQNKILIFDRESSNKVDEIIVDDLIDSEKEQEVWLLYIDENQIYSRISSYGVLIFNKENLELVKEIPSNEMLFFVDDNYIYVDDGSQVIIYDKNNFNELNKIDTTLEKSKFGSNGNYFVNIEREIDNHFHLKIWNKETWEISHRINLGVRTGNLIINNNEIYIGSSSSDFTERHIKKYDFYGNFQGKLWGNHGKFAIPIYAWKDSIVVFTQVTKEGGSGTCLFLQNWKR